jgi:zinc D-Ala-D-Ala carboxypeptidase
MKFLLVTIFFLTGYFHLNTHNHEFMIKTEKEVLLGIFRPELHPDFTKAEYPYTLKEGMYLRKETYDAFRQMHDAAKKDGIQLVIVSATRTFQRQKEIWENKWNGNTLVGGRNLKQTVSDPIQRAEIILRFSSMPGTSRHHWGTDIDINSVSPAYFSKGKGQNEYNWLVSNATQYGFCQPYKLKGIERPSGYEDEPWHWSFIPLSCNMLEEYILKVTYEDIQGFQGADIASELHVLNNYVNGIHSDCKCKD